MPRINIAEAIKRGMHSGELHTVLAPRTFDLQSVKDWLKAHNLHIRHRTTKTQYRFNQRPEVIGAEFYSKRLPNGLLYVFQSFDNPQIKGGDLINEVKKRLKKYNIPYDKVELSPLKDKKIRLWVNGRHIDYGLKSSQTWIENADEKKMKSYQARASKITNKNNEYTYLIPYTKNYLSFWTLWT